MMFLSCPIEENLTSKKLVKDTMTMLLLCMINLSLVWHSNCYDVQQVYMWIQCMSKML